MIKQSSSWVDIVWERILPVAVLGILLAYTYIELGYAPYVGFNFSSPTGEITLVFVTNPNGHNLKVGDMIRQVDNVSWENYQVNLRQRLFPHVHVGQLLTLHILRGSKSVVVPWLIQPPPFLEILDRAVNVWWLGYLFWFTGLLTILLLRPKDTRWRLLVLFYFLTAIWLVAGNTARWRLWDSAIVLRSTIWLALPVYLHLHWIFPQPLPRVPPFIWQVGYLLGSSLAILQWFEWLSRTAFFNGFILVMFGSLGLLILHYVHQPSQRRAIRLILLATTLAFIPLVIINLAYEFQAMPWYGAIGLLGLLSMPGAYLYVVYRQQLGDLELRTNRLIALYLFLLWLGTLGLIAVNAATAFISFPGSTTLIGFSAVLLSAGITLVGFPRFQQFVETHLLGVPSAPTHLLEMYAARIATRLDLADLSQLLQQEILPSLLIRQSALLRFHPDGSVETVFAVGIPLNQVPKTNTVLNTFVSEVKPRQANAIPWVRLALPLRLGNQQIGVWLLGRRDPDDDYAQAESITFQALADQTAIALTNIDQATQLRAIYQANIDRHEMERTSLAHELHDEVLHQFAVLALQVEEIKASPAFEEAYQRLTTRIRQIITGLRPAMMQYGLYAALAELVEDLTERAAPSVKIQFSLPETQVRYAERVEQYVFRIVQQACENSLRHAHAHAIGIHGALEPASIRLTIQDDGVGFTVTKPLAITTLLAHKHFGLVGMQERAALIGGELRIEAIPGSGTQVTVSWGA